MYDKRNTRGLQLRSLAEWVRHLDDLTPDYDPMTAADILRIQGQDGGLTVITQRRGGAPVQSTGVYLTEHEAHLVIGLAATLVS